MESLLGSPQGGDKVTESLWLEEMLPGQKPLAASSVCGGSQAQFISGSFLTGNTALVTVQWQVLLGYFYNIQNTFLSCVIDPHHNPQACHQPHFIAKETKVPRGLNDCPRSHSARKEGPAVA
jgi:hypothetical protein